MPSQVYGIPSLDQVPSAQGDVSFNSHKETNVTDPTNPQDGATKNYVDLAISAISQNSGSGVISGCGVAWDGTGLVFDISAGTYSINGVTYSVAASQVTLATADASNPRIDLIIVNSSSAADKITGTPAANPVAPSVDPSTQLQLTFVYVAAGATTPGVTNTLLYDENVGSPAEWNASNSGSGWNLASTNNPHTGTKDIEATSVATGAYAQLQKGSGTVDPSTFNSLVFWIRSKASWGSNRSLTIGLLNGGTQYGNAVSLRDGVYGFSSSNTTGYQQIVIPLTAFSINANLINQVRFIVAGSGSNLGFYLDTINFQAGVNFNSQNFLVWRQTWSSTTQYARNDVVTYNGIGYVCQIANVNSAPSSTNSNWQAFGNPIRPIGFTIDGGGKTLTTGQVAGFQTIPVPGKITAWSIGVDAGTATVQTWKVATGTAVPTSGNSISTAGVAISSGTYIKSSNVADFTNTTVATDDIFAWNISAVATATKLTYQAYITQM